MSNDHQKLQVHGEGKHGSHGRPYLMFWVNMVLGLAVMYVVMFTMIDGSGDFRNNLNMFYMAVTMWAPMGIFMLVDDAGHVPEQEGQPRALCPLRLLTAGSLLVDARPGPDRRPPVRRIDDPPSLRGDPDV